MQTQMVAGPVVYKRKYALWVLVVLIIICWPAAIIYYFTREKVPVQEMQTYATPAPAQPMAYQSSPPPSYSPPPAAAPPAATPAAAPNCPRCGKPATFVPQYGRHYCYTCQQYV